MTDNTNNPTNLIPCVKYLWRKRLAETHALLAGLAWFICLSFTTLINCVNHVWVRICVEVWNIFVVKGLQRRTLCFKSLRDSTACLLRKLAKNMTWPETPLKFFCLNFSDIVLEIFIHFHRCKNILHTYLHTSRAIGYFTREAFTISTNWRIRVFQKLLVSDQPDFIFGAPIFDRKKRDRKRTYIHRSCLHSKSMEQRPLRVMQGQSPFGWCSHL